MTLQHICRPGERVSKLKNLIKEKGFVRVIESHNGISGLIASESSIETPSGRKEFDALWESSLTDSTSKGLPDIELVSVDSRLQTIEQITRVTDKPIIFDGDTGGEISQFEYLVPRLEYLGVSAIIIEDKVFPKKNSLDGDAKQELEDPEIFASKIKAGQSVKRSEDFMIIARLESLIAGLDLEDALMRAEKYLEAGVDGIMIHSKDKDPSIVKEFVLEYKKRFGGNLAKDKILVSVPTAYNSITDSELKEIGFNVVIHANHLMRASMNAMEVVCKSILRNDRTFEVDEICVPVKEVFRRVGYEDVKQKEKGRSLMPPIVFPCAGNDRLPLKLGQNVPKALIDINGKSLLQWQVDKFREFGFNDINVIVGFQSEKFNVRGVNYLENREWESTFTLNSLMKFKDKLEKGFIVMNPDTIMNKELISSLVKSKGDIVMIVDDSFQYHSDEIGKRLDLVVIKGNHGSALRELKEESEKEIVALGKNLDISAVTHEALSVVKFSEKGAKKFIEAYERNIGKEGSFYDAKNFENADFMDLIQEMMDNGIKVNFIETHKGWIELHDEKDYQRIQDLLK